MGEALALLAEGMNTACDARDWLRMAELDATLQQCLEALPALPEDERQSLRDVLQQVQDAHQQMQALCATERDNLRLAMQKLNRGRQGVAAYSNSGAE